MTQSVFVEGRPVAVLHVQEWRPVESLDESLFKKP
jgi:hypothetical protein